MMDTAPESVEPFAIPENSSAVSYGANALHALPCLGYGVRALSTHADAAEQLLSSAGGAELPPAQARSYHRLSAGKELSRV